MEKIITGIALFLPVAFGILFTVMYVFNIVKFVQCDFETDYKCEVIHAVGIFVPPASLITVWFDTDGGE